MIQNCGLLFFLISVFTLLGASPEAVAQTEPAVSAAAKIQGFTITANNLVRDVENGKIFIEGNVKIVYQNQFFEADSVVIDLVLKRAILKGKVTVQTAQYQIGGNEVQLDYESGQGLIYSGFVQSNNVRFQGNLIEKISDTEFDVAQADYTTCSNCPATWSFQASQIKAELGGYAYLKSTFFKVGHIPIFWLPYLAIPLKSDRQTGLLPPSIGYIPGRGVVIAESLFWAPSRSHDVTFTLKNYELGGLKPLIEYRYALAPGTFGTAHASYLHDSVFASDERFFRYHPDEKDKKIHRWSFRSTNQYAIDETLTARLQASLVNDLQYPKDFYDEFKNYTDPALENRLNVSKQFTHSVATIDSSYYRNLLSADPLSENKAAVHRAPEFRFDSSLYKLYDTPFYFKMETSFAQFVRTNPYDDMSVTGGQKHVSNSKNDPTCENKKDPDCKTTHDEIFDPAIDQIRTGKRASLRTSLVTDTYNLKDFANIGSALSFNETQYFFPVGEKRFNARHYVQLDVNSRTKFYRIYDDDYETTQTKYKHEIIPEIQYTVVPWIEQETHPFFGNLTVNEDPYSSKDLIISNNDLNSKRGLQYDFDDRVYDRNVVAVSVLNRVVKKKQADNSYKTVFLFRLSQAYDLFQAQYGQKTDQPLSNMAATMVLDLDHFQSSSQVKYSPYQYATNSTTTLSYLNDKQQYFKVGLTSNRIEAKQDDISFAIGFVSPYINVLTGVVFDASADRDSSKRLKRTSFITQLKPPGECWAVNFYYDQKQSTDGQWNFTFDFSYDGKPTKVIPPAELKIN